MSSGFSVLDEAKKISASEAQSLIAYSNNSGPLFVIGAVGVGIFGSLKTGLILYAVQIFCNTDTLVSKFCNLLN